MAIRSRTSDKENLNPVPLPPNARWLMPSIGDLIFVSLLGLLTFTVLSTRLLGDAGIGWHIRTGQLILATHAIPHVDPFSSTMSGHPWFAWEWLYDVIVGWFDTVAGLNGVVFFTALVIAATFSCSFRLLLRWDTNFLVALLLVLLAASASMIHFLARPHVVSWLFTVLWYRVLESSERFEKNTCGDHPYGSPRFLWFLPVLMLVWVNVHGGFMVAFVLLGIFWVGAVWQWLRLKSDRLEDLLQKIDAGKRARSLVLIGILSALVTLVNPYGWKLHVHIYTYLSNRFLMDHIDEFQSPNFHRVAQQCFAVLLMLAFVAVATRKSEGRRIRASGILVVLFAMFSGLYASRNIPVSSLLLVLVIAPWLSDAAQSAINRFNKQEELLTSHAVGSPQFFPRMQAVENSLHGHLWPIAGVVLIGWIVFHGGSLGGLNLMHAQFEDRRFPVAAVDYFKNNNAQGPVFSPDSWGGYLIYRLYPQIRVVVDDRHDLYGENFLKSYLKTLRAEPGWQSFFEQFPVGCVVIPKDSALANLLSTATGWRQIYGDDMAVIFVPSPIADASTSATRQKLATKSDLFSAP